MIDYSDSFLLVPCIIAVAHLTYMCTLISLHVMYSSVYINKYIVVTYLTYMYTLISLHVMYALVYINKYIVVTVILNK